MTLGQRYCKFSTPSNEATNSFTIICDRHEELPPSQEKSLGKSKNNPVVCNGFPNTAINVGKERNDNEYDYFFEEKKTIAEVHIEKTIGALNRYLRKLLKRF